MRRLAAAAIAASLLLLASAGAQAASPVTVLVGPSGRVLVSGRYVRWARSDRAPAVPISVGMQPSASMCGFAAQGCTADPDGSLMVYASTRSSFLYELGHAFDLAALTAAERRYLAAVWGVPRWHWWDRASTLRYGARVGYPIEDGLEGIFGFVYRDCAEGVSTRHLVLSTTVPRRYRRAGVRIALPTVRTGAFDSCRYLREVAAHDAPTLSPVP